MPVSDIDFDIEDVIEQLCYDVDALDIDDDVADGMASWYPEEYVILVNGFRGSGKTVIVCDWGGFYLEHTDHSVYTNLDYNMGLLQQEGFKNLPLPLDWERMISFNMDQVVGSLNQIDEIDTYLDKLRTNSNQNVLTTKFLEQLRKRSLKFIFSCQFGNYLPYGTLDQVDMTIDSQDLFFTPAGREAGLGKGERFLYTCRDKSGLFTGGRTLPWFVALKGKDVWPWFETGKLHDPTQFAKKFTIDAGTVDSATGETYYSDEVSAHEQEAELRKYRYTVQMIWGSPLMSFLQENAEAVNMQISGNKVKISTNQIEQAIASMKGPGKKDIKASFNTLKNMAQSGSDVLRLRGKTLEIMRPQAFALDGEEVVEQTNSMGFERVYD